MTMVQLWLQREEKDTTKISFWFYLQQTPKVRLKFVIKHRTTVIGDSFALIENILSIWSNANSLQNKGIFSSLHGKKIYNSTSSKSKYIFTIRFISMVNLIEEFVLMYKIECRSRRCNSQTFTPQIMKKTPTTHGEIWDFSNVDVLSFLLQIYNHASLVSALIINEIVYDIPRAKEDS